MKIDEALSSYRVIRETKTQYWWNTRQENGLCSCKKPYCQSIFWFPKICFENKKWRPDIGCLLHFMRIFSFAFRQFSFQRKIDQHLPNGANGTHSIHGTTIRWAISMKSNLLVWPPRGIQPNLRYRDIVAWAKIMRFVPITGVSGASSLLILLLSSLLLAASHIDSDNNILSRRSGGIVHEFAVSVHPLARRLRRQRWIGRPPPNAVGAATIDVTSPLRRKEIVNRNEKKNGRIDAIKVNASSYFYALVGDASLGTPGEIENGSLYWDRKWAFFINPF